MTEKKENLKMSKIFIRILLLLYSVIVIYPLFWNLYSSFKTTREFYKNPWVLPEGINFTNYITAFEKAKMGSYFLNSVIITLVALAAGTLLSVMSAYAIGRFQFPFSKLIKNLYMSSLLFPGILGLIPLFLLLNSIHLIDNRFGLIIVYTVSIIPFSIYVILGFIVTVSKEYEESAMIDGCSHHGILFRIVVPLIKPAIITTLVFNFIGLWNEYLVALTFISTDSKMTMPVGLANLLERQRYATDWGALFAGLVLVMLPTVVFYAIMQRKITGGLTAGGLKG